MDLQLTTETFGSSQWDWLASGKNLAPHTVTLDVTELVAAFHYPDGHLVAGTLLGKITANGLWKGYESDNTDGSETALAVMLDEQPVRLDENGAAIATAITCAVLLEGQVYVSKMPNAVLTNGSTADVLVAADLPAGFIDADVHL